MFRLLTNSDLSKKSPIILCTSMIKFWNINYHSHFSSDEFLNSFAWLMPTCTLPGLQFLLLVKILWSWPEVCLNFYLCMLWYMFKWSIRTFIVVNASVYVYDSIWVIYNIKWCDIAQKCNAFNLSPVYCCQALLIYSGPPDKK